MGLTSRRDELAPTTAGSRAWVYRKYGKAPTAR